MDFKSQIDLNKLPRHVAIIMDGNGRWAKQHNQPRVFGHRNGVRSVREVTEAAAEIGVEYLTLYAFSTENWARPKLEVDTLMRLLVDTLSREIATLNKNNIRLEAIGDLKNLPEATYNALQAGIAETRNNSRMTLVLALNYSGKWDIIQAVKGVAEKVLNREIGVSEIDERLLNSFLTTRDIPDPELLIRTSGEHRLSNFLLWQLAYAELYFSPVFWPDFSKEHFYQALLDFQNRERRFGRISEQLAK